jgi:hypothetical protein
LVVNIQQANDGLSANDKGLASGWKTESYLNRKIPMTCAIWNTQAQILESAGDYLPNVISKMSQKRNKIDVKFFSMLRFGYLVDPQVELVVVWTLKQIAKRC